MTSQHDITVNQNILLPVLLEDEMLPGVMLAVGSEVTSGTWEGAGLATRGGGVTKLEQLPS